LSVSEAKIFMRLLALLLVWFLTIPQVREAFEKAESLYDAGKYELAKNATDIALQKAAEAADTTGIIKALCLKADIAIETGDDTGAIDYYNSCSEMAGYGEPMFTLSSSLYNIAMIYYQNGDYDNAETYITKSIDIDSKREKDAILALRYLLAAQILFDKGDYDKSVELSQSGRKYAIKKNNYNVAARLSFIETRCREAIQKDNPNWEEIEQGYRNALEILNTHLPNYYYGAVNPYSAEIYYHLGLVCNAQGKDGKQYLEKAIINAGTPQKMRGMNPAVSLKSCELLSEIYQKEGDEDKAAIYRAKTDSLSFVPYVHNMSVKLSLSQMEFIRREKERQIEEQRERALYFLFIAMILATALISMLLLYRRLYRQKRSIEEKNGQLIKLGRQKEQLINMIRESSESEVDETGLEKIANDTVPLPDVKLSKREKEIILQCCKGLTNKEIASVLNISVRTVESHKFNICRKIGVNTTNELITFAFKTGLCK